jgi:hypothetical protein
MRLRRDQAGGVLVEATVMIPLLLLFTLGSVDFLFALYQWNAATKAVQLGARIAAVSNPVVNGLNGLSTGVLSTTVLPGDPMPAFNVTCDGGTSACSCTGSCTGVATAVTASNLNNLVYGRGRNACASATWYYEAGMCNVFSRVQPANVMVQYSHTATDGLGYAGRPGGPVATVTVSLQNLPYQFFFLGGLMGFSNIQIPAKTTTITSEDLSSSAPT